MDDPQSRFINERVHANIQKDGTYSVVPRMYGGVTTPDQLRKIADVADKYAVPMVKAVSYTHLDVYKRQQPQISPTKHLACVWMVFIRSTRT